MQLDPLSIVLQIINFLVLLWLLKRFLYRPIRVAIEQRQLALQQGLADARRREQDADSREREYLGMQQAWEAEKLRLQSELQQQLLHERETNMERIHQAAAVAQQRMDSLQEQERTQREARQREQSAQTALQLSSRLLQRLAGSTLDQLLLEMLLEDLQELDSDFRASLMQSLRKHEGRVALLCAHPLPHALSSELQSRLSEFLEQPVYIDERLEPALISGMQLHIGSHVLHANLADELAFFARKLNHEPG